MTEMKSMLADFATTFDPVMLALLPVPGKDCALPLQRLSDAMAYSATVGGKRLRPFLACHCADLFNVPRTQSLRVGGAVELLHCYSLVHDDLPAMDDSDVRRGRPSVHKAFDEATAILVGDALLTEAFAVLVQEATHPSASLRLKLASALATAAGSSGMVGGQMLDLAGQDGASGVEAIEQLQWMKTGALITFSCMAGAILGDASSAQRDAMKTYARMVGLAFQITDDLLDVEGNSAVLGKPVGQDAIQAKSTFVQALGAVGARAKARDYVDRAKVALHPFGARAHILCDLADYIVMRKA